MSERITRALVRDVDLEDLGTLALITLDNQEGPRRPNTLGPNGMAELRAALTDIAERARRGEIVAAAVTGKMFHFAAGADLHGAASITTEADARGIAETGHEVFAMLADLPVPSFAYIGGAALGGGLELALHATYRTVAAPVRNIGLPETFLGLIPGWGGTYLLPHLVGIENALTVIIDNPLRNNRQLNAEQAVQMGIADVVLDSADFLAQSLRWSASVLRGLQVARPEPADKQTWQHAIDAARAKVERRLDGAVRAPYRALDLLALAAQKDRDASYEAENDALAELILSPQFAAGVSAFDLTTRRAKNPAGAPDADLARPVRSVGIAGAGLMASQLALLFARRMRVPVIMRDLDDERARRGLQFVHAEVDKLAKSGRIDADEANRLRSSVTVTTDLADLAGRDLVIEAVFEELKVKKKVFAEQIGRASCRERV